MESIIFRFQNARYKIHHTNNKNFLDSATYQQSLPELSYSGRANMAWALAGFSYFSVVNNLNMKQTVYVQRGNNRIESCQIKAL